MDIMEAVAKGYELAKRKGGVARAKLVYELEGNIGWKKYLDRLAGKEGLKVKPIDTKDGVVYTLVSAGRMKAATATKVATARKVAAKKSRKTARKSK